jgi:uncharacterized membrane protein YbhN (UPF0104 family)
VQEPAVPQELAGTPDRDLRRLRTGIVWTVALLALLLAVGLAVPDLRDVLTRVAHAQIGWLVLALGLEIASCLGYVAIIRLVLRRGPAQQVRWLAWAEMAFGAVVPVGGAGGLAVGAWAMRAWGLAWSRIANRSAVIFLLTSAVNAAVLALAGIGVAVGLDGHRRTVAMGWVPAAMGIAAIAAFVLLPRLEGRLQRRGAWGAGRTSAALSRLAGWVRDTEAIAFRRDLRVLGSIGYLLFDIAVLWACLRSVGARPPLFALVVGYQVGYLANLLPIPGGVGVLEGGLLGALLLYGLPAAPTAAAVVLYHAIALWVPAIGGTVGFARLRGAVSARAHSDPALAPRSSAAPAGAVAKVGDIAA